MNYEGTIFVTARGVETKERQKRLENAGDDVRGTVRRSKVAKREDREKDLKDGRSCDEQIG